MFATFPQRAELLLEGKRLLNKLLLDLKILTKTPTMPLDMVY